MGYIWDIILIRSAFLSASWVANMMVENCGRRTFFLKRERAVERRDKEANLTSTGVYFNYENICVLYSSLCVSRWHVSETRGINGIVVFARLNIILQ